MPRKKKPRTQMSMDVRNGLKESDRGSYYQDWSETYEVESPSQDLNVSATERKLLQLAEVKIPDSDSEHDFASCNDDADSEIDCDSDDMNSMDGDIMYDQGGYRLWDMDQIGLLLSFTLCSNCVKGKVSIQEDFTKRNGWNSVFVMKCSNQNCKINTTPIEITSSTKIGRKYKVNICLPLAMRTIGKGRTAAAKFSAVMGMPPPVSVSNWIFMIKDLKISVSNVAEREMKHAAKIVHDKKTDSNEDIVQCAGSLDGSWKYRGMSSSVGLVMIISVETGQIMDRIVMCNTCRKCQMWDDQNKDSPEYEEFFESHYPECPINHEGSSQSMECAGAVVLFQRSVENNRLEYIEVVADGDCKTLLELNRVAPYGDKPILKKECVGHVQKRCGTRLRRLLDRNKGQKLSDGKGLGGKGRLTLDRVRYFQILYGKALRDNKGNPQAMSRQTLAILHHYKDPPDHQYCTATNCTYLQDKQSGENKYQPPKDPIPQPVFDTIIPVFKDLADPKLLEACKDGLTQNQNESAHHVVWGFVPKDQVCGISDVELGVDLGILVFNIGITKTIELVFKDLGLNMNKSTLKTCQWIDNKRLTDARYHITEDYKASRKDKKIKKKGKLSAFRKEEGVQYQSCNFHTGHQDSGKGKQRQCKTCGAPMKGHKRSLCGPSS